MAQDGFIWNVATGVPTKLGTIAGNTAFPMAASHDGSVVVGYLLDQGTNATSPARWDNGVLTVLPTIAGVDQAVACSADASVIIGAILNVSAGYWTGGGATGHVLPPFGGDAGAHVPINVQGQPICSNDGSIIIGNSTSGPITWTNGVPALLPDSIGSGNSTACSDDGSVISGFKSSFPFFSLFWRSGTQYLAQFGVFSLIGEGLGIRANGSVIYGVNGGIGAYWTDLTTNNGDGTYGTNNHITNPVGYNNGIAGFTFANTTTMMTAQASNGTDTWAARFTGTAAGSILQTLSGWLQTTPKGISGDGAVIAGTAQTANIPNNVYQAVTWDAIGDVHLLQTPASYFSTQSVGISRNGAVVYGVADRTVQWIVTSPLNGETEAGVGNLWIDSSYTDFTNPSVLAGFVNSDGSWIDVGYYGQLPTGSSPLDYLTVQSGNMPNDFLQNYSLQNLQNQWVVSTTGVDPTTGSPYPTDLTIDECAPPGVPVTGVAAVSAVTAPTVFVSTSLMLTDLSINVPPIAEMATLRWSDDAGASWSNGLLKSIGRVGDYFTTPTWYRLGMSRNRIIELSWSSARPEALQGVFLRVEIAAT